MDKLDLAKINQSFEELERQRSAIKARIRNLRASYSDALIAGNIESKIEEVAELEEQLAVLDKFLSEKQAYERKIFMETLQEELEKGTVILDGAEQRQAEILSKLDKVYAELEKHGRELLKLRREVFEQIPSAVGALETIESKLFLKRRESIGKIGWDIKRAFYTYEIVRGRFSVFQQHPEW
jgi:chromosome segregation ATPase